MQVEPIEWAIFFALVVVLLIVDLFVLHRKNEKIPVKSALIQSAGWIAISLIFGVWILFRHGVDASVGYYAAYVVEKAMSVDNLFVFIILFSMFSIPDEYQHKALFYGIIGAMVFRGLFIFAGSALLENISFMMYIFGALLVILAIKTAIDNDDAEPKTALWLSKHMNVSPTLDGGKFFTVSNGVKMATPLLLCVIAIELTDIVFAIDSVPACLAITSDTFIVYTSNIFAILGLRSLYFALHGSLESLRYMKYGLSAILIFVGMKMILAEAIHFEIGVITSLLVILGILAITIIASLLLKSNNVAND